MVLEKAVVLAGEPAEEEEEEEIVDPLDTLKESCQGTSECKKYQVVLDECSTRVSGRSNTTETCMQELYDFVHCTDHCVAKSLFSQLK